MIGVIVEFPCPLGPRHHIQVVERVAVSRAHRVSARLKAGICWVNTYRAVSPIAPFGGFDQSGYGREAGIEAIHDYTRTKTTWINTSDKPMANPFVMR